MGIFTDKNMEYDIELLAGLDMYGNNSITLILEQIKPESKVLEFGPAYGRMTKYLKEELDCRITCVEKNEKARNSLEKYADKVVIVDIESYKWEDSIDNETYDIIIFADVLEHLYNPKEVLSRSKKYLKQEGLIFVSIPNIAHSAILEGLYNDEFEYQGCGILDETHIRFFTKKSFEKLIKELGLYIASINATYYTEEMASIVGGNTRNIAFKEMINKRGQAYAYQYVYGISKQTEKCLNALEQSLETLKVYVDFGDGFEEKDARSFLYEMKEVNRFEIDINENRKVKGIRIDPTDVSCVIVLNELKIINEKKEEICFELRGDFFCIDEKYFLFPENDPKWLIQELDGGNLFKLILDISFLYNDLNSSFFARLYDEAFDRLSRIPEIEKEVEELEREKKAILFECEMRGEKVAEMEAWKRLIDKELRERGEVIARQKVLLECKNIELNEKDKKIFDLVEACEILECKMKKKEEWIRHYIKREQKRNWKKRI